MSALVQKRWDEFLNKGLPTQHDERWKYTDLSFLAAKKFTVPVRAEAKQYHELVNQHRLQQGESILLVFVNGYFMPSLSDLGKLPPGVIARSINEALIDQSELIRRYWRADMDASVYPFANMNASMFTDGLFLYLPAKCALTLPVHLLSLATDGHEFAAHPHHLIVLDHESSMTFVEEYAHTLTAPYLMNIVTSISVGASAMLNYYKIQTDNHAAVHLASTFVHQQQDSHAAFMNLSSGSLFARDDVVVTLRGRGAECSTRGFYRLSRDHQYIDHHVDITHIAPHTQSEMLYKGTLDQKSKAVFNGRLCVQKDAQKILAYQANHNILLSNNAEVYSKPELEIYADDVKCKHGATTGQLDQDALFYFRSRGIERQEAMKLLLQGFAEEIIQKISHPGIRQRAEESIR